MFDHLSLGVRSLTDARSFYDALLAPLGHRAALATDLEVAYGPAGKAAQFFLYPVDDGLPVAGSRTHVAFRAAAAQDVDRAYAAAVSRGAQIVRAAGRHPDISETYYGAIFLDPDGNKLEILLSTPAMAPAA